MDVSGIVNLNQYAVMQAKLSQAQMQGTKKNDGLSVLLKQSNEDIKAKKLQAIKSKLKSGQRLSPAEMEYLRNNDPKLYETAVKIAKERNEYRRDLKRCKTKTSVQMANVSKLMQFKLESKYEDPEVMFMRVSAILNEHSEFVKTNKYCDLPIDEKDKKDREDDESNEDIKKPDEKNKTDEDDEKADDKNSEKTDEQSKTDKNYEKIERQNNTDLPDAEKKYSAYEVGEYKKFSIFITEK